MWNPYAFLQPLKRTRLAKKQHLRPKLEGVWARGTSKKYWDPLLFLQPLKVATSNLVHKLGLGLAYQKTTIWTKIGGNLGQGSIRKNVGPSSLFLQPLKLATSNLVHKLGLGLGYQKTFWTKIGLVWAKGASKQNLGPPTYFTYFCNR